MSLQSFECNVAGREWQTVVNAITRGGAKAEYLRHVRDAWPDVPFTAVRARKIGSATTPDRFLDTARYRGVPFARIGMRVEVGGDPGIIAGVNASANFDVLFTGGKYSGHKLNCHPRSEMRYFDENGVELLPERAV